MASLLRQIIAGPRIRHPETGLDFCYVTDTIIATSGPSSTYPKRAYRNPLETFVEFLDNKYGSQWFIWEFRAEGTGYTDDEVYNRIQHFPWPDHHPPPFALIPKIMASMRDWLKGQDAEIGRVVVVHCKAGKGRSGTVACSYLISEEGWAAKDALARFTSRRMRAGFGEGVSIPSQQRWIKYVEWWTKHGKVYEERPIEILEVRISGLKDSVRVAVQSFIDEGRAIKTFHTFSNDEQTPIVDSFNSGPHASTHGESITDGKRRSQDEGMNRRPASITPKGNINKGEVPSIVLFRPFKPIILPISDVNIDFERRNKALYGFTMVTSVAHVWFNAFFESRFSLADHAIPKVDGIPTATDLPPESSVFSIPWEAMDGVRGFGIKGARAFDRLSIVWRAVPQQVSSTQVGVDTQQQS